MSNEFLEELKLLIMHEGNNGDYYVDGYVDAGLLSELINKHFPEEDFHYDTYCRWEPRKSYHSINNSSLIPQLYAEAIKKQLESTVFFTGLTRQEKRNED